MAGAFSGAARFGVGAVYFHSGSVATLVLGAGHAIIGIGTGAMSVTGAGYSTIHESATGGVLSLNVQAGIHDIYGFRVGTDRIGVTSHGAWSDTQSNGSTTLTSSLTGATYRLHGVLAPLSAFT